MKVKIVSKDLHIYQENGKYFILNNYEILQCNETGHEVLSFLIKEEQTSFESIMEMLKSNFNGFSDQNAPEIKSFLKILEEQKIIEFV